MLTNPATSTAPLTLRIVAYLFIIGGIFSVIDTVIGLFMGRFVFNLGVLYIFIGQGLLRLDPRWLTWALLFTWLGLIGMPLAACACLLIPAHLQHLQIFWLNVGQAPQGLGVIVSVCIFASFCWQYRVLKGRQIHDLFLS